MATYGLTFLQIINRVLVRLRESSVAANDTTDYSQHIGQVVNQVKNELEAAFYWNALRETYDVAVTAGNASYALTDAGPNAVVISGWNYTTGQEVCRGTNRGFDRKYFGVGQGNVPSGPPYQYLPAGTDDNYDVKLDLWPNPDASYTLKFNVYKPQDELAADATVPLVPQDVLIEETIARMLVERGDEEAPRPQPGETFILKDLLAAAIAREAGRDETEMDWIPE